MYMHGAPKCNFHLGLSPCSLFVAFYAIYSLFGIGMEGNKNEYSDWNGNGNDLEITGNGNYLILRFFGDSRPWVATRYWEGMGTMITFPLISN